MHQTCLIMQLFILFHLQNPNALFCHLFHYLIYTQLYISFDLSDPSIAIDKVNKCISDIRTWMIQNKLKINDSKTKFLVLTSPFLKQHFNDLNISLGNSRIAPSISARNLGVIFDNHMSLDIQINSICKSAFFHLRNIGSIRNMLTDDACSQLIHSLVTVRIDYCNFLLYGMPDSTLFWLQKVLNTAARIFKKIPKFSHITDIFNPIRSGLFQTVNTALKDPPPPPLRSRKLLCQSSPYHTCEFCQVFLAWSNWNFSKIRDLDHFTAILI